MRSTFAVVNLISGGLNFGGAVAHMDEGGAIFFVQLFFAMACTWTGVVVLRSELS